MSQNSSIETRRPSLVWSLIVLLLVLVGMRSTVANADSVVLRSLVFFAGFSTLYVLSWIEAKYSTSSWYQSYKLVLWGVMVLCVIAVSWAFFPTAWELITVDVPNVFRHIFG